MDGTYNSADAQATPSCDIEEALDFLEMIAGPDGRIALAKIEPDGPLRGATCTLPAEREVVERSLRQAVANRQNVYFSLNQPKPRGEQVGKAGKITEGDVDFLRGVSVDLDPDPNAEAEPNGYEAERARLFDVVADARNSPVPPTAVVDTGNGVQMHWLFPEQIASDEERRAAVKAQAAGFADRFGGDAVQSVDHLFRIPGLPNFPNAKKRQKGRGVTRARLLYAEPPRRYALTDLAMVAAPREPEQLAARAATEEFDYSLVLQAAEDGPDSLTGVLANRLVELRARRGFDAVCENTDRSERDFALAAHCIGMGMANPTEIGQLIFAVSPEKLLEKDAAERGEDYAFRTVSRALERTKPDLRPEDFFTPIEGVDLPAAEASKVAPGRESGTGRPGLQLVRFGSLTVREPEFLVDGLIETDSVALLFGDPACGKSFLAIDIAACVASGRSFHGRPTRRGPVVYIAGEGHAGLTRRRDAWERSTGTSLADAPFFISLCATSLLDPAAVKHLATALKGVEAEVGPPSLLVFDTLARNFGPGDENDTQDMNRYVAAVDALRGLFARCTAVSVHHTGHGDKGRARGAMALRAALDAEYRVEKSGSRVTLTSTKMKDALEPRPICFDIKSVELGVGRDGKAYSSAVLEEVAGQPEKKRKEMSPVDRVGMASFLAARDRLGLAAVQNPPVHVDEWRVDFYRLHTGDDQGSKRRAFNRCRERLTVAGRLVVADNMYTEGADTWPE